MPLPIRNLHTVDTIGPYVVEKDVDIPLNTALRDTATGIGLIRANVYRPKDSFTDGKKYPVLVTYGPYGKDIPYSDFHPQSFSELNPKHRSVHSAWETPDPAYWTSQGYAIVRADERGTGQSPGKLDTMSAGTSEAFFDVVEWAAIQPWSTGKVGLLGISYYAGSQWRVAARRPKGLAAIIPWEGMSDYYRDRVRHGGILSNDFISWWWNRQVVSNQYGLGGRTARKWGLDSHEGNLSAEELEQNRADQTIDTAKNEFRDQEYFKSRDYDLENIEVPILSVANWGGILLHLRGNVIGYMKAGSSLKYLRFITGRHDLPFFYEEEVKVQLSFLDAFLKDKDTVGWSIPGKLPAVDLCLRKGNPGYNNAKAELGTFPRRMENEWPIKRTVYVDYHLSSSLDLSIKKSSTAGNLHYEAPSGRLHFISAPFEEESEITGHPSLTVTTSLSSRDGSTPKEIDIFVTIHHYDSSEKEVFYTGTTGEPVPVVKGWLRVSQRALSANKSEFSKITLERDYLSTDVQPVELDKPYTVPIEIWPTQVVLAKGDRLGLTIASCDTEGSGLFTHTHKVDRSEEKLKGWNNIHFGEAFDNILRLPIIPRSRS